MGRMHSKGKGLSRSSLPYKRSPASWVKTTETEVAIQCKLQNQLDALGMIVCGTCCACRPDTLLCVW